MLHHASLSVVDLERAAALYDAALAPLGYRRVVTGPGFVGYGIEDGRDKLGLMQRSDSRAAGPGSHLALSAPLRAAVDAFHAAALEHGASDNGGPGLRPHYGADYYAAFVIDLDGHRLEAVCKGQADPRRREEPMAQNFQSWHPVLGVGSMAEALAYYVDWLGFRLDGEWEEAPGEPKIAWISRDGMEIALSEHPGTPSNTWLNVEVADARALAEEWNRRRPGAVEVVSGAPYEFPVIHLSDPFGNRIDIQQPLGREEEARRRARIPEMRAFVARRLAEGGPVPSPEELVSAVGPSVGIAIEVLNEFPEYARQFGRRRS